MKKEETVPGAEPWWLHAPLGKQILDRYGLSGESYPICWGFDLTASLPDSREPAVLWVAIGAEMALTTLILDDYSSRAVIAMDLYGPGTSEVRIKARDTNELLRADDLRGLPVSSSLADLAALGDVMLAALTEHLESGQPLMDLFGKIVSIDGRAEEALMHLIGIVQKRRRGGSEEVADLRRRVVENYLLAVSGQLGAEAKKAPRKAVSKVVFKGEAYVGRLLVEARDLGLLEKTTPGRKNQSPSAKEEQS